MEVSMNKKPEQPAPAQEPVIQDWMKPDALCDRSCLYACTEGFTKFPTCVPPPSHTSRIGLTDEEFVELCSADLGTAALIRAVEAKLKEKNGTTPPAPAQPLSDGYYVMQIDGGTKKIWPMTEEQALVVALHGITKGNT
jgi:hypothetical protein